MSTATIDPAGCCLYMATAVLKPAGGFSLWQDHRGHRMPGWGDKCMVRISE